MVGDSPWCGVCGRVHASYLSVVSSLREQQAQAEITLPRGTAWWHCLLLPRHLFLPLAASCSLCWVGIARNQS